MAKRQILTKNEKKMLGSVIFGLLALFIAVVLIISSIPVEAVVEGVEPTAWQAVHSWFIDVKDFFFDNYILLLLFGAVVFIYVLFRKRK